MGTVTSIIFLLLLSSANASLSNQIGSSPTLTSLNLLLSGFPENATASQSQHPALISNIQKSQHAFYTFMSFHQFKKTNDIILQNEATTGVATQSGAYDPNPRNQLMLSYQFSTPLSQQWFAKSFGLTFIAPIPELLIIDTTSSFLPKYYWYDSRLNKTELLMHFVQKINDSWSSSLSFLSQWDLEGQSEMTAGLSSGAPSSGRLQSKVKAKIYPHFSALLKKTNYLFNLSWQPPSKQKLENRVIGKAPIGGTSTVDYTFTMLAQNHFDPMQVKADFTYLYSSELNILLGASYQDWSKYESNRLLIVDADGVITNSESFENLQGKNIISPAMGMEYRSLSMSYRFRPRIFEIDHRQSGNTLDQDTHILGLGWKTVSTLFNSPIEFSMGAQYHHLPRKEVQKSPNQEDGAAGSKIGAPNYEMGGSFMIVGLGLNYSF